MTSQHPHPHLLIRVIRWSFFLKRRNSATETLWLVTCFKKENYTTTTTSMTFLCLIRKIFPFASHLNSYMICTDATAVYQNADSWIRSKVFCEIQQFIDWSSYVIIGMLVAWSNIEKHIIIFHDKWISSFRKRLFLHLSKFLFYFHLFPSMY